MRLTNSGKCRLYKFYAFIAYALPMAILFFANLDDYRSEGSIFGFWGFVILAFVILAFKNFFIDMFKKRTLVTVSIVLFVFALLMRFLSEQMLLITGVSAVASILSTFIAVVADVYSEHAYKVVDGEKVLNKSPAIPDKEAWREAYGYNIADE